MQINFEENPFLMDDIGNYSNQNPFMKIIHDLYKKGQFDLNYNFPIIELEEEKQDKNKQFIKSFKEVFMPKENLLDDDDIYFQKKVKKPHEKEKRKKGRPKKDAILEYEVKKNKFDDNLILQKITRNSFKNSLNYINKTYQESNEEKKSEPLLRMVDAGEYNVYSNQKIYELFNKTLGDVFSADISRRNFNFIKEHSEKENKIIIES